MIDWLTIGVALVIIASLVGIFSIVAWKINMSDPLISANITGKKDDTNQLFDSVNDKKSGGKKKRKEVKKPKRNNKEDDHQRHSVTFKEPSTQTSEETDNEREESELESSTTTPQVVETSSKARKRNRHKARQTTPPPSSAPIEGILVNKGEKSPVTARAQPISHPKLAVMIPKDEVELAKQHQQQAKTQVKPSQPTNKQTVPAPPAPIKKPTSPSTNVNQGVQKQQQQQPQEQPFTTVGGNRHKAGTPPSQQQQQQQNKPINTTTSVPTVPAPSTQQPAPVTIQHEQLAQRQPPRQQKETPTQHNGFNTNPLPVKQPAVASATSPTKLADLVKALPTSQAVVTELMSALDAFPLSTDELDIIMHKIANKQSVIKQDWSKLQHGQKVDPQAHIGQVLDESARAYEEDMKTNAIKRIKELTDECNNDKRRIGELMKESNEKDMNIQVLHAQLNSIHNPQQQLQTYQTQLKRLTEENMQLQQRFTQQQHFQQQQQLSSMNLISNNNNNTDSTNIQVRVLSDQMKKLSVDNGNLEKQVNNKDLIIKELQKEKDDLLHSKQQLTQKVQESQKQFQHNEDKLVKELNENRTLHMNQLNEYKRRIEQLELDNEKIRIESVNTQTSSQGLNNEERDKYEQNINQLKQQLNDENEQYKKKLDDIQSQYQSKENELRQEIEQLKKSAEQRQNDESQNNELATKNAQIDALRVELEEAKAKNDATSEHFRQEQDRQKQFLVELLEQDVRNQLPNDNQDLNQWLSSYRQLFVSSKQALQDETKTLKHENEQLHKNMSDVTKQIKEIEQKVQNKEELLFNDLRNKDVIIENIKSENDQLNIEMQRLRAEIDRLQLSNESAINDTRALKLQLDERLLVNTNSPSVTTDDSFEYVKQPSPTSTEIDPRAEQLNELIRSGKEALENQDSIAQQLDKHLNEMHRGGTGEISTPNVDESTVSPSSDQQQSES